MAPAAGFEPATKWLTATYSTAELCRNSWYALNLLSILEMSSSIDKNTAFFLSLYSPPLFPIPPYKILLLSFKIHDGKMARKEIKHERDSPYPPI